ncbi:MAG: HEAT repeat domain-containing protein [Halodesulfurarchaeum sp.]
MAIETILLVAGASIVLVTTVLGAVTLLMSWWYRSTRRRNAATRDRVQEQLLEQVFRTDPDWEAWVDERSETELRQLRQLIDEYLRRLRGSEYERLCELARTLGIPAEAKRNLDVGRDRFRALTWLALLDEPIEPQRLQDCCTGTQRHSAGAARVLLESNHPEAARVGTELLIGDGNHPLSAFGMDTLYRLNTGTKTPLLSIVPDDPAAWDRRLLVQVLTVLRYCSLSESPERLAWLVELLDHDSPRVRAATVGIIERHGWREAFQRRIDIAGLLTDPAPAVRYDAYQLLASWGSDLSAAWLLRRLEVVDDREILEVLRALSLHPRASVPDPVGRLEPYVEWVQAEAAIGRRGERVWGVSAAWA